MNRLSRVVLLSLVAVGIGGVAAGLPLYAKDQPGRDSTKVDFSSVLKGSAARSELPDSRVFGDHGTFQSTEKTFNVPDSELAKGPKPVAEAFHFRSIDQGEGRYALDWVIAPYYYLYLNKFSFAADPQGVEIAPAFAANTEVYDDPYFGTLEIYRNQALVDLLVSAPAGVQFDSIKVTYQGCWEGGICYPPQTFSMPIGSVAEVNATAGGLSGANSGAVKRAATVPGVVEVISNRSNQRDFGALLDSDRAWLLLGIFYLAGLALAFTPCVFPTIPLVSGMIARRADSLNSVKGMAMAAVFVLAMSLTYAAAGVVAGLLGKSLQIYLQQTWIIIASALCMLVLAGSMFGLYPLQLPAGLRNRLYRASSAHQQRDGWAGLAGMGMFSALIVAPCITAPLAGILLYLGGQGDPLLGAAALFVLGIGMGTPLVLVGLFAATLLPGMGAWMHRVQHFFGFAMLLLTVWMLDRVVADDLLLLLYGMVLIAFSVYLWQIARLAVESQNRPGETLARTSAIVLLVVGVLQIAGYSMGGQDVLQPLKVLQTRTAGAPAPPQQHIVVYSIQQLDQQIAAVQRQGKPVMLKFDADWCIECEIIDHEVFGDPEVAARLADLTTIQVDVTDQGNATTALLTRYATPGPPTLAFYDSDGTQREDLLLIGNINKRNVIEAVSLL